MSEIIKKRIIRPSSRNEQSKNYKVDTKKVSANNTLVVNITHENKPFCKTYEFNGEDVACKGSIHFRVIDSGTSIDISWSDAQPMGASTRILKSPNKTSSAENKKQTSAINANFTNLKTSFDPISNPQTSILILGTMPGDKSLELNEYYGHSRNRFWKIISSVTNNQIPVTYSEKKSLLLKSNIAIWDVAYKANRIGSLDVAIEDKEPNDLNNFIAQHKNLKVIGFNGRKAQILYDKYFDRRKEFKYFSLPSTSPANTGIAFDKICAIWKQVLDK